MLQDGAGPGWQARRFGEWAGQRAQREHSGLAGWRAGGLARAHSTERRRLSDWTLQVSRGVPQSVGHVTTF